MPGIAKVPVVMQTEALECGAAALCMILAYYGKWLPLEQVRSDCSVSQDGSSVKNVVKAARAYGLNVSEHRMEPAALRDITWPAIVHWNLNHFVVLNGFKKDKAVLNDPAQGRVEVALEEFYKSFNGMVLRFEKTDAFVPEGKPKSMWESAKKRLRGTAASFAFIMLTGLLTSVLGMITPIFSKIFLDNILSGKNPEWLMLFTAAMAITLVFQFAVGAIEGVYWLKIEGKIAIEANASFMWHALRLPVEFFSQRFAGDIVSRQESNESIASSLISKLAPIFMNVCLLIFYLAVMINYSITLSVVGIAAVLINMVIARFVSHKRANMARRVQRDGGKLSGVTMSGLEMIETIKASGAEIGFFERWSGYFTKQRNALVEFYTVSKLFNTIPPLLQQMANIGVLMIGVYLILDGDLTIGMLIAFQGFLTSFLTPVNQLVEVGESLIEVRSQMERLEDVMNYKPDVEDDEEKAADDGKAEKLKGEIHIGNVTFGYNRLSLPLIEGFSLSLKPGQSVAFVGGSGSGKSTLAKLISGLYQPWFGEIRFDGLLKNEINRGIFTASLAVVDQDVAIFEDTVINNITMWDRTIDEVAIVNACKDAQMHDEVMGRQGGYSHIIKEGGKNFSGGQRQRFEIARAFAQQPSIIILDEATSALDTKTEQLIMEAIKARGITLIIIAHRLSTIRDCDEIIVLDKGKVVERGTHEQLIKTGGQYAALISN
ncbi:NHLP family bacteriocin export ABC transporter peptidase/permease/ATPase subunit [Petroclostridium sp. X23]|uniref:NHLP family bacteriocin export ABC transporter peptidase/permease/ATPase subunit n=1 Tax=Petroclostridium sp. X23 TaxID=3045146 RepID=UPI0024ACD7AD|nr:NHLP family bacteriocin export ABC transporter peptidase/permease/ATPase subunit [Petroclostridium sp. X23]WHH58598.1 NHLP family bacteriocin export ABC transporter peptidase/permease/ATPase subunit [Petroclostridium sp. X23]